MAERYDAVIVGAGVIGAAVALELARRGRRTLNLDALPAAGYGSTSASAAIIRVYYSTLDGIRLAWEGYHYWQDWAGHLGLPAGSELARYRETGAVVIKTQGNRGLAPVCALMQRLGIPYQDWDAARLRRELPYYDLQRFDPPRGRTTRPSATATARSKAPCCSRPAATSTTRSWPRAICSRRRKRRAGGSGSTQGGARSGASAPGSWA